MTTSFGEALERFVGTEPKEMHANIAKARKAKPPGGKKAKPAGPRFDPRTSRAYTTRG
jgi:hypothetical protein